MEDQQDRAESLRTRGVQIAGFSAATITLLGSSVHRILGVTTGTGKAVLGALLLLAGALLLAAVVIAILGTARPKMFATISADEVKNYTTDRFQQEPDLWRVHVRTLRALQVATENAQAKGNEAAKSLKLSLYLFLAGLVAVSIAVATLVIDLGFSENKPAAAPAVSQHAAERDHSPDRLRGARWERQRPR